MLKILKRSIAIVLAVIIAGTAAVYADETDAQTPINVSIINLIATPEKYHGKFVRVVGVGHVEFESDQLFLSGEDMHYYITKNSLWLNFDGNADYKALQEMNGCVVLVEGIFNANNHGHLGLSSGGIRVSRYEKAWEGGPVYEIKDFEKLRSKFYGYVDWNATDASIINLIATPERYDGKVVRFVGIVRIAPENSCVYLSSQDYHNGITLNSVRIEPDYEALGTSMEELAEKNGNRVIIEGVFDSNDRGPYGLHSGTIKQVSRYSVEWEVE